MDPVQEALEGLRIAPNAALAARIENGARLFHIQRGGDPYSSAWECHEYNVWFDYTDSCTYRGDISGMYGKMRLRWYLRRNYPGCIIREDR